MYDTKLRWLVYVSAFLLAASLNAQLPTADVEVTLVTEPPAVTPPGSIGTFSFLITNHGPDTVGDPLPATSTTVIVTTHPAMPYSLEYGRPLLFASAPDDDCLIDWGVPTPIPGNPPTVIYTARFYGLEPGDTARCELTYLVDPEVEQDLPVTWSYFPTPGIDPDDSNNSFTIQFRLGLPEPIPTLTPAGIAVLVTALVLAFAALRRRRLG